MGAHYFPHLSCLVTVIKPRQGLITGAMLLHLSVKHIAKADPRAPIWIPPSNGVSAIQKFYKRGAHYISGLTFGWP